MEVNEKTGIRRIRTSQFGEIEVEQRHIFTFETGLLGFETLQHFVLIAEEETLPFKWLISIDQPEIGFPLLSPWHIDLTYNPGKKFNLDRKVLFVVVTLENSRGLMTANMKAPIILDVVDQSGLQTVLPKDRYSPDFVIPKRDA